MPLLIALAACNAASPAPKAGDHPPGFVLPDLSDKEVNVPGDFTGKVVVIRFWADWCPYCKDDMKDIEHLYKQYKEMGLVVLAVNVAQKKDIAEAFTKKLGITYPVLLDSTSKVAKSYGVVSLPTTFLLDRSGTLKVKFLGETNATTMQQHISSLITGGQ
ncbi:MAG: TlpA family protein disulfide reductase [Nitrospirae bacterium]|nr:TlpA family protein disulfide reductase [Nitrospirota bacterium]